MGADIADIKTSIWADQDFENLSPLASLLFIWTFSNPRANVAGLYLASRRTLLESKVPDADLEHILDELEQARFVRYVQGVIWVRTQVKHLRQKNPPIAVSIARAVASLAAGHELRIAATAEMRTVSFPALQVALDIVEAGGTPTLDSSRKSIVAMGGLVEVSKPSGDGLQTHKGKGKGKGQGNEEKRTVDAGARVDALPDDLPEQLHAAAKEVVVILSRVADAKAAHPVTLAGVGRVVANLPDRDHVSVAQDVEHYWLHGTGQNSVRKDIVATYRNRLASQPSVRPQLEALPGGAPRPSMPSISKYDQTTRRPA
jgi:hypothetical protein